MKTEHLDSITDTGHMLYQEIQKNVKIETNQQHFVLVAYKKLLRIADAASLLMEHNFIDLLPILIRSMDELVVDLSNAAVFGDDYINALYYQSYTKQKLLAGDNPNKFSEKKRKKLDKRIHKLGGALTKEAICWLGGSKGEKSYMSFKQKNYLFLKYATLKKDEKQEIKFIYYLMSGHMHNAPKMTKKYCTEDFNSKVISLLLHRGAQIMLSCFNKKTRKSLKPYVKDMKSMRQDLHDYFDEY